MIKLKIEGSTHFFDSPVLAREVVPYFHENSQIIALRLNNEIISLSSKIEVNGEVKPVFLNTKDGAAIYRRTLCFVLEASAKLLFPESRLVVGHSLGYGYYYTFYDRKITKQEITKLENKMKEFTEENLPITNSFLSHRDACALIEESSLTETLKQLKLKCKPKIKINTMGNFSDLYFEPLAAETGILKVFELKPYDEGFLLRFPAHEDSSKLVEFSDNPKIFEIYKNYKEWGKLVNVTSAASLNELILNNKINDFIDIAETHQSQHYASVALKIHKKKNTKVVLIAGPSSSGKTTSAKKLALQLLALGYNPRVISLDNYYVGRDRTPKDSDGKYDFECLEALDIPLLNENLKALFAGKPVEIPSYNFDLGQRFYTGEKMVLEKNDILIMEGIHALNGKLTPEINDEFKFKIYLSALTQLNLDDHNRIPTSDNRLIRRIVRDSSFRGKSASETIGMWESVQRGERKHIFPFQDNADAVLNTALDYELPVLKVYAAPLLRAVSPDEEEYSEACRLLNFLDNFNEIPESYIPKQSIIREFIGGSSFHY